MIYTFFIFITGLICCSAFRNNNRACFTKNYVLGKYKSLSVIKTTEVNLELLTPTDLIPPIKGEKDDEFLITNVHITDMYDIIKLANNQFLTSRNNFIDVLNLDIEILKIFLPKLLMPAVMKHSVLGIRSSNSKCIVGFVDVSLQASSGNLDVLKPKTFKRRQQLHNNLEPYLCNLFISPVYRRKGLAKSLINACEIEARLDCATNRLGKECIVMIL